MKTLFYILGCVFLIFALAACSGKEADNRSNQDTTTNNSTETTTPENGTTTSNVPAPSQPVPTGISHEPYTPADSSDYLELDGGVKMYFIEKGDGEIPSEPNQILKAHYHAMLEDGTVFESSFDRGIPLQFPLAGVIKGWQTGLMNTPVGSKIKLIIPPSAGFGSQTKPGIPANSTLVYDVHLLEIL
jgi:FKBP-type peptidyl-prolyl cis-trans isomerase